MFSDDMPNSMPRQDHRAAHGLNSAILSTYSHDSCPSGGVLMHLLITH